MNFMDIHGISLLNKFFNVLEYRSIFSLWQASYLFRDEIRAELPQIAD